MKGTYISYNEFTEYQEIIFHSNEYFRNVPGIYFL